MDIQSKNKLRKKKRNQSSPKLVYISSPMKVKTTASKFRSLVQLLTGRDSDITRSMEVVQLYNCSFHDSANDVLRNNTSEMSKSETQYDGHQVFSTSSDQTWDSSTNSESFVDQCLKEEQYLQDVLCSSLFLM